MCVFAKESKVPLPVPEYHFGDELANILKAGFAENSALQSQWNAGAPGSRFRLPGQDQEDGTACAKAAKLVEEAAEYFVLETLSIHLTDYFNKVGRAKKRTVELRREQVPEVLLTNRFLSLFSAPMEDRPAFVQEQAHAFHGGQVVAVFAKGARYSRFDLVLPKKSAVKRREFGAIELSTPRLRLTVGVKYDGFSSGIPFDFCQFYLRIPEEQVHVQMVMIEIHVSLKLLGLISGNWDYYRWVDSFLSTLEDKVSFDGFLQKVQWSTIAALLRCRQVSDGEQVGNDG
jgi:hypothetical protein